MGIREELRRMLPEEAKEKIVKQAKLVRWFNVIKTVVLAGLTVVMFNQVWISREWFYIGAFLLSGIIFATSTLSAIASVLKLTNLIRKSSDELLKEIKEFQQS